MSYVACTNQRDLEPACTLSPPPHSNLDSTLIPPLLTKPTLPLKYWKWNLSSFIKRAQIEVQYGKKKVQEKDRNTANILIWYIYQVVKSNKKKIVWWCSSCNLTRGWPTNSIAVVAEMRTSNGDWICLRVCKKLDSSCLKVKWGGDTWK